MLHTRLGFYLSSIRSLGLFPTLDMQLQKKLGGDVMRLRSPELDFPIYARRQTSDLYVFSDIFIGREYRCLDDVEIDGLVVDLGANVGYSSAYFLSRFKSCRVIAVEPDTDNFNLLKRNVEPYGDRITAIQGAIWPGVDQVALDNPGKGEEWGIKVNPTGQGSIRTITIPEIMRMAGADRISLLKIDIEGAEEQLFNADTDWLDRVDNIVIELHGKACEDAFFARVEDFHYTIVRCDELTVCFRVDRSRQRLLELEKRAYEQTYLF